jgi:hypothetical protein
MGAPKRTLPPALAANRWRPGQSGNPSGLSGEYGEAVRIARSYAPAAMRRLAELAALNQLDGEGNLLPLGELPDADRRVIAVAANAILDRALGKPKEPTDEGTNSLARMSIEDQKKRVIELLSFAATLQVPGETEGDVTLPERETNHDPS